MLEIQTAQELIDALQQLADDTGISLEQIHFVTENNGCLNMSATLSIEPIENPFSDGSTAIDCFLQEVY